MKLFKVLVVSFITLACVSIASAEDFTVNIINDTDVKMVQITYWLNHDLPKIRGPFAFCVAKLKPGEVKTIIFGTTDSKKRLFVTVWSICISYDKEQVEKYASDVLSVIPTGKTAVKIYHKRSEVIPK